MRILKTELLSNEVSIVNLISDNEMIDVKELRVGNLVLGYYAYNDENDQEQEITSVCRVLSIDSVGAHEYPLWVESIGKANDVEEYDGFVAIPLTEDWLLRFGFELSGRSLKIKNFGRFIFTELGCSFYPAGYLKTGLKVDMQYVHQLQNLYFALTGKELEPTSAPEQ